MAAAGAAAGAAGAAAAAAQAEAYWMLFKHQIRLSTGLLKRQYQRGTNLILAPNALVSSLSTLIPKKETDIRVDLVKMLLCTKCNGRLEANDIVTYYCYANKHNGKRKGACLHINSFIYSHPSRPLKPKLVTKLWKKYRATVKELEFGGEKPNLEALATINADAQLSATCSPMMSTADYVRLIPPSTVRTVLSSALLFNGMWSKSFEVQYGEFHRSDGTSVKTPLLMKKKSYQYYYDAPTMAKVLQIHATPESKLQLMLILPDENISVDHYIHHMLNYDNLKRIFKKLNSRSTRADVQLVFPKFNMTSSTQIGKPTQTLALKEILELNKAKPGKSLKVVPPVDDHIVLLQKVTINIQERGADKTKSKPGGFFSHRAQEDFIANRPFIFALYPRDDEKLILMIGVCEDPTKN